MAFENLNSLENLNIQNNKLTSIPEDIMEPIMDTLRVVDIMGNASLHMLLPVDGNKQIFSIFSHPDS